jgi:NAD(P)-dependent dehydrogenase (short-subunit alcohol dehydrogenase family)
VARVVVITGGSAGVGRATARRFARDGAALGLIARGRDRLDAAVSELEQAGARALAVQADVADPDAVEAAADRFERELGPIDVWINNAMATVYSRVRDTEPEEFRRVTEVTYLGFVWGTMAAVRRMLPRDRGTIVFVGSALAYRGIPLQAAYCGAKHAIEGFFDSLRTELLREARGIHVTMVQLPALNTPQFDWSRTRLPRRQQPVPPIFQPEVAADAIHWAAHHRRREVYAGWPTVQAIVGDKLAPGIGDLQLARTGFEAQQTDEPVDPDRPDNLFEPVSGDFAAHGRFDDRSLARSIQLALTKRRDLVAFGAAAATAGTALRRLL